MKNTGNLEVESSRLDRGPDLAGYAEWKSTTSLEACLSSEVSIQEVSSSVPSYPVQQTRYNSLQAQQQLSILELRSSEILNSSLSSRVIGRDGVECNQELDSELLVPTCKHGKPGVQCGDCPEVIG